MVELQKGGFFLTFSSFFLLYGGDRTCKPEE